MLYKMKMINFKNITFGKKERYGLYALSVFASVYSTTFISTSYYSVLVFVALVVNLVGAVLVQIPNVKKTNALYTILLPIHLTVGTLLSLNYFPNLSNFVVLAVLIVVGVIAYAISLVNNIFLVVEEREKTMPLYRVAITWSQILLITVAIPYFSGIFKLPYNFLIQASLVGLSGFLLTVYLFWTLKYDEEIKVFSTGEKVIGGVIVAFNVMVGSLIVSFIPTESFLRALFISSVLMSQLGYLQSHFKNSVTKKLQFEYLIITIFFLMLVLLFKA